MRGGKLCSENLTEMQFSLEIVRFFRCTSLSLKLKHKSFTRNIFGLKIWVTCTILHPLGRPHHLNIANNLENCVIAPPDGSARIHLCFFSSMWNCRGPKIKGQTYSATAMAELWSWMQNSAAIKTPGQKKENFESNDWQNQYPYYCKGKRLITFELCAS